MNLDRPLDRPRGALMMPAMNSIEFKAVRDSYLRSCFQNLWALNMALSMLTRPTGLAE